MHRRRCTKALLRIGKCAWTIFCSTNWPTQIHYILFAIIHLFFFIKLILFINEAFDYSMHRIVIIYLLVKPKRALFAQTQSRLCKILDPLELSEHEFARFVSVYDVWLPGDWSHGHWCLTVGIVDVSHGGLRIVRVLARYRQSNFWPRRHFSHSRWVWHVLFYF